MKRCSRPFRAMVWLTACATFSGCSAPPGQPGNRLAAHPNPLTENLSLSDLSRNTASGPAMRIVELVFDVIRAEFSADTIRHSHKVWNHVDELRVDANLAVRLARNGLRVGAASMESWPAIEAVFRAGGARLDRAQLFAQHGLPLSIELVAVEDHESIFSYGKDHRLIGKTFSVGNKIINLDYAYHPELDGVTDIRISFEVRHDRGVMTWERRGGIIRQVPSYDRYVFDHISIPLTLHPGEFLIIGPGEESQNEYLIGSRFLRGRRDTRQIETLLCIKPQPYQTRRTQRRPL